MKKYIKPFQTYIKENIDFDIYEHIDIDEILKTANEEYDSFDDEITDDEFLAYTKDDVDNIINMFDNYTNNPIEIYRTVNSDDISNVHVNENIGECWSFLKESSINFAHDNLSNADVYMIEAKVYKKDVNWQSTIELFFTHSFNLVDADFDRFVPSYEAENEIRINKINYNKIFDIKIEKINI